ncbi:MAG: DNA polymerase Y family protein, partial [Phycisphaerae bacterium]
MGFRARVAIAPSGGSAWALARYGPRSPLRVDDAGVRGELEPLPIEALRLSRRVVDDLALVGVRRVGELLKLPRASLAPRYGGAVLLRIEQALG